jgi:hypothetical protein
MRAIGKERVDEEDKNLDEEDRKFEHRDTEKMRKKDKVERGTIGPVPLGKRRSHGIRNKIIKRGEAMEKWARE